MQLGSRNVTDLSFKDIKLRSKSLTNKFSVPLSGMSDHQILEMDKRFLEFDKAFNEILDKITMFAKCACGVEAVKLLEKIAKERDTVSDLKEKVFTDVSSEIIQSD